MDILVIGGTHFIGKRFVEMATDKGYKVTLLNRGSRNIFPELETIISDRQNSLEMNKKLCSRTFDVVIDFCGYSASDLSSSTEAINLQGKQYVFLSSAAVYSRAYSSSRRSSYGEGKQLAEDMLIDQSNRKDFSYTIVRSTYVYGPNDVNGKLKRIYDKIISKEIIYIDGSKNNKIHLVYVDDLVQMILSTITSSSSHNEIFDYCGDEVTTSEKLIKLFEDLIGQKAEIVRTQTDSKDIEFPTHESGIDNSKAKKLLGVDPKTSIKCGVSKTLQSFME